MAPQMEISTTVYCDHQKNAVLEKRFEGLRVSSFALDLFGLELFLVLVETLRFFGLEFLRIVLKLSILKGQLQAILTENCSVGD